MAAAFRAAALAASQSDLGAARNGEACDTGGALVIIRGAVGAGVAVGGVGSAGAGAMARGGTTVDMAGVAIGARPASEAAAGATATAAPKGAAGGGSSTRDRCCCRLLSQGRVPLVAVVELPSASAAALREGAMRLRSATVLGLGWTGAALGEGR